MGKASNKKKSNKAARANIFDLSTLGIDIHAIAEEFKANLKDDLYADLYLAIKANEPSKLEKLIIGLLAIGVKVYSEEISISNGELSDKVDLFQAAILNKSGNVLTWLTLDAIKRDLMPDDWLRIIYSGPDTTSFPPEYSKLISDTFVVLMRESDLLDFEPTTIDLMKQDMGPNATEIFYQVIGEQQAKHDHEELLKCIPDVERESATEAEITIRRKTKSI